MTDEQFENELRARATRMTNLAIKLYVEAQSLLDMLSVVDDAPAEPVEVKDGHE